MGVAKSKTSLSAGANDPLERAIEASLRRQFEVPAPLPNPGASVPLSKWEWPTLSVEMPRVTLRAAAGLLMAASLWGASGLLVVRHMNATGGPRYASASPGDPGAAVTSRPALVNLAIQFTRPTVQVGSEPEDAEAAAVRQAEMWAQFDLALGERYGQELQTRARELRESEHVELVAVQDSFVSNETLLMVAARIDGKLSAALLETTDGVSRLKLPEQQRGQNEAAASRPQSQLFRGTISGGLGYEITGDGEARLIQLLFPDAVVQPLMKLRPERYRAPQRPIAIVIATEGTRAR